MKNLKVCHLSKDEVYTFVEYSLHDCKIVSFNNNRIFRFHHNASFEDIPFIIKHGILSPKEKAKILENRTLTERELIYYHDDDHVNGSDSISLAEDPRLVDESEMYPDEDLYDPFRASMADINIDDSIKAYRNSKHYYNEFLASDIITPDNICSIDTRILLNKNPEDVVKYYNQLLPIAEALIENPNNILLREVSDEKITFDTKKLVKLPKIEIK